MKWIVPAFFSLSLTACGGGEADNEHQGFTFMLENVQDFQKWPSFVLNNGIPELYRGFVNKPPPAGSRSFPKATIIIKSEEPSSDPSTWHVYGMAKRGAGYNANGAVGWEWLELIPRPRGQPGWEIDWRGPRPRSGATYRCVENLGTDAPDCNTCHKNARDNDYVMSEALRLHNFN